MILQITDPFPCEKTHTKSSPLWCGDESKRLPRARFHVRNLVFDRADQRHTLLLASDVFRIGQKKKHWFIFGASRLGESFDKVQHSELIEALDRLAFFDRFLKITKSLYNFPTFFVQDQYSTSTQKTQLTGIRHGCPLSPYLFLLVMTCIDHDVKRSSSRTVSNARIPGVVFDAVYYADDTYFLQNHKRSMNFWSW